MKRPKASACICLSDVCVAIDALTRIDKTMKRNMTANKKIEQIEKELTTWHSAKILSTFRKDGAR